MFKPLESLAIACILWYVGGMMAIVTFAKYAEGEGEILDISISIMLVVFGLIFALDTAKQIKQNS